MILFLRLSVINYFLIHVAIIYVKMFARVSKFLLHLDRESLKMQRNMTEVSAMVVLWKLFIFGVKSVGPVYTLTFSSTKPKSC